MSNPKLPERASLEYLKKLAKDRLHEVRRGDPEAKLADAQLALAREYGFASWRALKVALDERRAPLVSEYFASCSAGDVERLRTVLDQEPALVRERDGAGRTGLHLAARHAGALRLLLERGADVNARDRGDNALALHFAAAAGALASVRTLLDAGSDVHGHGDVHRGEVIGWAARPGNEAVVALLLERGASHHVFSAIALGDAAVVQRLVESDPECLQRRRSRFEGGQSALHAALAPPDGLLGGPPQYELAELLLELGADVEAEDDKGRTPLAVAMLRGDQRAMQLLKAAGAREPARAAPIDLAPAMAEAAETIDGLTPMLRVPDVRRTVDWYRAIGFSVDVLYEDGGEATYAKLSLGKASFTLSSGGQAGAQSVSLWLSPRPIEPVYRALKSRQLEIARAALAAGSVAEHELRFGEDLYEPFYGGRQFSITDLNGFDVIFYEPL